MNSKKLFLMCGAPGSGKSTWVANYQKAHGGYYVSRDLIRFEALDEDEDYFSKEDWVFTHFIEAINRKLRSNKTKIIYVDATHLTEKARNKVLDRLQFIHPTEIIAVDFSVPLAVCLERNAQRTGRAFVPENVVRRMHAQYVPPTHGEKYGYDEILHITN